MENIVVMNVLQFAKQLFFDDDGEHEERQVLEKIGNFAEETVPNFTDRQFKRNFRMLPETFEHLLVKIHGVVITTVKKGHPAVLLEKQLLIALWCLSNMQSFRSVAGRFGISESSCWSILYRICKKLLLVNTSYKIIAWPTQARAAAIKQEFQNINGFPGVIGAIDGCHIRILKPKNNPNSYVNRKGYHSVLLQGMSDNRKLFMDVYAGEPGSIHDSTLFRKSDLSRRIEGNQVQFYDGHLIGDLAYSLPTTLMVGFKDYGTLTMRQKNCNYKLSQVRAVIENAFAYLKGRFRRLKYLETIRLDLISLLVMAACVLHNVCILNGDSADDILDIMQELVEDNENDHAAEIRNRYNNVHVHDIEKRNIIVQNLELDRRFTHLNELAI